jgi:hypothetical protein
MPSLVRRSLAILSTLALPAALVALSGGAASARVASTTHTIKSTSLGTGAPTFTGPAATGCATAGCSLLSGPFRTPSTAGLSASSPAAAAAAKNAATAKQLAATAAATDGPHALPSPVFKKDPPAPTPPTVSCQPLGPGCDPISMSAGGAKGVRGLNAVDSGTLATNPLGDIEPADQGLCAGNGYVVEDNNIGEILVFNQHLQRKSSPIPLDTLMGLTGKGWSSGGDISCLYDSNNGGHWFFTQIVSESSEASGGPFAGCFAGATASDCLEGIAVTKGSNPFGPYNVYFVNANYNPNEPGYPFLFNDFAKISATQDAFLLFYDEFPNNASAPGIGGGGFNGSQEFAFDKNALERGLPVTKSNGKPNPKFNVAVENLGFFPTPDGTCASDNTFHAPGITCWYQTIPAQAPDPSQYDNNNGGSGFMLSVLDFYGNGDNRFAVFDWTGLRSLNSTNCSKCAKIQFGGQLFSNTNFYFDPGFVAPQKAGPIPLGNDCGAAMNPPTTTPPGGCPEGGIATNGDGNTQVAQAQNQIWGAISTLVGQTFKSEATPEVHAAALYSVVGTRSFDKHGFFTLTSQGYVSPKHEDLEFPAMAAEGFRWQDGGNGGAIMTFTLSGNGGSTGANRGGFFPSTAFGRLSSTSGGLTGPVHVVDLGQSPQDGFTEYQGFPGPTGPRWGDYSWAVFVPWTGGKIDFATNYIQFPNCTGSDFNASAIPTCGGTRDGMANWGTSVNYVVP